VDLRKSWTGKTWIWETIHKTQSGEGEKDLLSGKKAQIQEWKAGGTGVSRPDTSLKAFVVGGMKRIQGRRRGNVFK